MKGVRRRLLLGAAVLGLGAVAFGATRLQARVERASTVPTVRVRRGDLPIRVHTLGELRSARSTMLLGPAVGGALQIVAIKPTGTVASAQDVLVEFDPSEQEFNLQQARSELLEVREEIKKTNLEAEIQSAQDEVALLQARFAVRRAELEVTRNELVSAIDAQKNLLNVEEARRQRAQLEQDIPARQKSNRASLVVLEEKLAKARLKMQQAQRGIEEMKLRAPVAGLVSVQENRGMFGGWRPPGMTFPEYREGDLVNPGAAITEVLQADQIEVKGKVDEADRISVNPGLAAEIRVDGMPGVLLHGKVKSVAGLAARGWGLPSQKKFDMVVGLDQPDSRLRAGVTTEVLIIGAELKNALLIPRQAVFEQEGKLVAYVPAGSGFEPRDVQVKQRSESFVAVEGLAEGTLVALVNPEDREAKAKKGGSSAPSMGGGR
ncbi:MAG TPA: HlyD family efflux transporter periplasmic adaptor subunit [Vicinamibacteria bacterium]|nr:HlyD family efflux transporter periplasmic adaptor subunit [Vicinamibacteria bacterium]